MKATTFFTAILMLAIGVTGCSDLEGRHDGPRSGPRPITAVELDLASVDNIYQAVSELLPGWLVRNSADGGVPSPSIYIEMRCTEITCLRWVEADKVASVHYLDPNGTGSEWLPAEEGPAIVVTLRTRATAHPDAIGR